MDEETHSDSLKEAVSEVPMDGDEGPLLNENSNGLSHLLTEGEFNSVDAVMVDESSTSNQGFLNAVELSGGSVGDYLENNEGFNAESFEVGDNAVTFPSETLNHTLSDGDSHLSEAAFKTVDTDAEVTESQPAQISTENEIQSEVSNDVIDMVSADDSVTEIADVSMDAAAEAEASLEVPDDYNKNIKESKKTPKIVISFTNNVTNDQIVEKEINNEEEVKCQNDVGDQKDSTADSEAGGAEETEVVSEDELPTVEKPKIKDAENVSDDELPGPKPAELPADTEVVSEDELPSSKKDGKESRKRKNDVEGDQKANYDPSSPTTEESASKKQAVVKNGESKPIPAEKRPSTEEKPKKKVLPELDKYWKVVNDDPTDFTGWTYLLQYVDQESDVEAAREAYDAFLSHYPYCYGYWRKYADYEKRKGSKKKCLEVLERGLKAIPLSVDLWIHYLNHVKTTRAEELSYIRSQYERAIEACGLEFRSDRLWESYIKWETEHGTPINVTNIYDRLLATPTLGYTSHFDNFQEHVQSQPVPSVISQEEIVKLREEVRSSAPGPQPAALDLPPGEDEPPNHIASDEEAQAIKERIIAARRKVHKTTGEEVAARWTFEEGIKRPYFHVKPLERCQLKNWKAYLEWEKQHGSPKRALILHERCLIACALYEEFWMRLIKFLEERIDEDPSLVPVEREALERACSVHHLDKPMLHLHWAHFEEAHGNVARAAEILERIEKACPNLVQIHYRRINLERRRGDNDKCCQLYESYINSAKNKSIASSLAIKYARFLFHVRKDLGAARKVLDEAIVKDPLNERLHLQRLDMALHTPNTPFSELEELVLSYEKQEGAEVEVSAQFAWRRRELAEELGGVEAALRAASRHRALARHLRRRTKHEDTPASAEAKKKEPAPSATAAAPPAPATYYGGGQSYEQQPPPQQQPQQYPQSYQPGWGYQQPPGPYQHPWPQYPNYY